MTSGGGMGVEGGREAHEKGGVCVQTADSLCFTAETSTTLSSTYTSIIKLKNKITVI